MKMKRLFSAVLAVAMVGINTINSILPVIADDSAPIIINQPTKELSDGVRLSKTAEPVPGYVNKYKITLRVEAPKSEKTSDTVLVIDHSNSMNGSKLRNAKTAANSLANVLLPTGNTVNRIAVVSYGESVKDETTDFSNQYSVVSSAISGISENGGGTFTQAAVRRAAQLIATSTATYKTVILLSDGAPSFSYGIRNFSASNDLVNANTAYGNRWQFKVMTSADKFNYNSTVGDGMGNASVEGSEMWDEAGSTWINNRYVDYYYNHGNSAIAEANFFKATGNTLYTIALDAGTWGNDTLSKMATTGKDKTATESNLKDIFDEIAGEISSLIKTAHVEDIMGNGVVVSGATGDEATTLTWDLEAKDFTLSDDGTYFYAEKSYEVDFTEDLKDEFDEESEETQYFALNKQATITYNDGEPVEFPVPSARPFVVNVEKVLTKIENGTETNLPDGQEFRFKVSGFDTVFSVKSGENHVVPVTVPIAINTTYTVTEENWVAEGSDIKFENYNVSYPDGNTFVVTGNQANEEVHIVIKNTYETTEVSASKEWSDEDDRDGLRAKNNGLFMAVKDGNKFVGYKEIGTTNRSYTIDNLPKYRNGTAINYTVVEATNCSGQGENITCTEYTSGNGYTATIKNGVITNTHVPEKIDLLIKKSWVGNNNLPDAITVNVSGGSYNEDFTITKDDKVEGECTSWCKLVPGLYKYENQGQEIKYKAKEISTIWAQNAGFIEYGTETTEDGQKSVKGRWDASETNEDETWTITNTWTPADYIYNGSTDFKVKKIDADGNPLAGVTFAINGEEIETDENGVIKIEIPTNLLVRNEEKNYEIQEVSTLDGYDLDGDKATLNVVIESALDSVDEMTLTNTYAKKFTFTASGNQNYVWNKDERMFVLKNKRSEAKSLVIEKIFEGVTEDELKESDLSFTISGPDDFEEKEILISEFVFVNDTATFTIVNLPTGDYTVSENGGEIEGYTMEIDGESEYSVTMVKEGEEKVSFTNIYDKIPEPEPTCETNPEMEECKEPEPEPEPTCETDPTMEGCEEPEPEPLDPCADGGGCGGIVIPEITPNTGKFAKNEGGKVQDESLILNYLIGMGSFVVFVLPIMFARKRKESVLTK